MKKYRTRMTKILQDETRKTKTERDRRRKKIDQDRPR